MVENNGHNNSNNNSNNDSNNNSNNSGLSSLKILLNPGFVSIVLALLGGAFFQARNNEQQNARIEAVQAQVAGFFDQVNNLKTPLSLRVIQLEDRVQENGRIIGSHQLGLDRLAARDDRATDRIVALEKELIEIKSQLRSVRAP